MTAKKHRNASLKELCEDLLNGSRDVTYIVRHIRAMVRKNMERKGRTTKATQLEVTERECQALTKMLEMMTDLGRVDRIERGKAEALMITIREKHNGQVCRNLGLYTPTRVEDIEDE